MRPHVPLLQSTKPCNGLSPGPKGHLRPRRPWKRYQHFYLQHQQSPIALPISLETTTGTSKGKTISKPSVKSAECEAEEDLPKVFQPFWSSKGVSIGKGMGLAVTHGLVKRHGGTISVQSKVGKGSIFTIRLPLAHEAIRKTEAPAMRPANGKLTILVIEDDEHIAPLLDEMFVEAGHSVFKALSGQEGLAIFDREHVDLVLCDLGMPGMNGWDVGKAIRSVCQQKGITKPPFILLTGWGAQDPEREKTTESGTDQVAAKPIDPAALIATVQEIAERFSIGSQAT
jgi:CheY-like chemotaxis protein